MCCDAGASSAYCAHVFRSTASTFLDEKGVFTADVEAQLARTGESPSRLPDKFGKGDKNKISGSYNGAAYYAECGCVFSLV